MQFQEFLFCQHMYCFKQFFVSSPGVSPLNLFPFIGYVHFRTKNTAMTRRFVTPANRRHEAWPGNSRILGLTQMTTQSLLCLATWLLLLTGTILVGRPIMSTGHVGMGEGKVRRPYILLYMWRHIAGYTALSCSICGAGK